MGFSDDHSVDCIVVMENLIVAPGVYSYIGPKGFGIYVFLIGRRYVIEISKSRFKASLEM